MQGTMRFEGVEIVEEKLLHDLRKAGHMIRNLSEGRASQKRILVLLKETGSITQRALTKALCVQSASSSEILTKMEEAGLILRVPNGEDRRTMDISLTNAGRAEAEAAAEQTAAFRNEMFACLTEEEKRTLAALLEKLNGEWEIRCREKALTRAETKEIRWKGSNRSTVASEGD